ncbi:MAG: SRPBCC family protein [Actinomycetota bacterium]
MQPVEHTAVIRHPQKMVFDTAADPFTQLKWDPETMKSVEKVSDGPLSKGSRFRANFKGFGTVNYEFADFDPPRKFSHRAKVKAGEMRHTLTFEEVPEGTRVTQTGEMTPNFMGKLMAPMMRKMLEKRLHAVASEVSDYLDGQRT